MESHLLKTGSRIWQGFLPKSLILIIVFLFQIVSVLTVVRKKYSRSFSGVGAKHHNDKAEMAILTISYWARSMTTHAALHWPTDNADSVSLWDFSVTHTLWLYNQLSNKNLGWMSPLEIFTRSQNYHRDLLRTSVWGCPAFVLHPKLQDDQKILKFNRRSHMGQFWVSVTITVLLWPWLGT